MYSIMYAFVYIYVYICLPVIEMNDSNDKKVRK